VEAVKLLVEILWILTPCSIVGYQRFRGPCYLHLYTEDGGSTDF